MSTEWLRAAYRCFDFDLTIETSTQPYPPMAGGHVNSIGILATSNRLKPSDTPAALREAAQKHPRLVVEMRTNQSSTTMEMP